MKLNKTFVGGKMNKDIDERLLPEGQYPHAENIRVGNSDASDVGAIENVKGNEEKFLLGLTNGDTIGRYADESNQKLYAFITSDEKDLVIEYDVVNDSLNILLESSKPNSLLNFSKNYLITGVVKIINGDSNKDLLVWTDDLNPPRVINIERAKTYGVDGFEEDDISLIKKPPRNAPDTTLTFTSTTLENNIEDKFLSFSYRYKYLDGEYSALSSFSNYNFATDNFELDYQTMENKGMINSFNAVGINFNTGSKRVTDIQLVFKESNSGTVFIIETFNKKSEGWGDDEEQSFTFANTKKYTALPDDELFRAFDNVPLKAKALELIGSRIVFGNYLEGYDLVNKFGEDINLDYNLSLFSKDLSGEVLPSLSLGTSLRVILTGKDLKKDSRLVFNTQMQEITYLDGSYDNTTSFIFNRDYTSAEDLGADEDFIFFVETILTNDFINNYEATAPDNSEILNITGFEVSATANNIFIKGPTIEYRIDNTPLDPEDIDFTDEISFWLFSSTTEVLFSNVGIDSSLKTNRSYEVGVIYLDEHGRSTTVLTGKNNTIYIPQKFSVNQNKIVANINHSPPKWADRYKLVVKQNKSEYQTIYTSIFYEEGLFRWVKLDGANKDKVKEGDTLIVKADLDGAVEEIVKVRVIEVTTQEKDFLEGNVDELGNAIVEESGLYMKIKPVGFNMNTSSSTFLNYDRYAAVKKGRPNVYMGSGQGTLAGFFDTDTNQYVDYEIQGGSRISIRFRNYESDGYDERYTKDFIVQGNYDNFEDWWNAEVVDLGDQENAFDWGFIRNPNNSLFMRVQGNESGARFERSKLSCQIDINLVEGIVIFETEPSDSDVDIYYETEQTFDIIDGCYHGGNLQRQSEFNSTAVVELDFFNCFIQGNGAESYRYKDAFNANYLNIDLRPSTTSIEKYKQVRRYADLTYSEVYNENSNVNGLNEFNLSRANFKEDLDKKYGFIQKLFLRDTDLIVFQEDKVLKILFGKDALFNADGTTNLSGVEQVLGQHIAYKGEYGISRNPESFAFDGFNIYFTDSKRGSVMRLGNDGLTEISYYGLRQWFRDNFKGAIDSRKVGGIDPYYDQYVLHLSTDVISPPLNINCDETISRKDFTGELIVNIDYGIKIGDAGFDYSSNGVPVKYDIEWDGQTFTTGYVGDPSYNNDLAELGLPPVSGSGNGTFVFDKSKNNPNTAKVTITSPLCDSDFTLEGNCVETPTLTVISIILNDEEDSGLTMKSRYRWSSDEYTGPYKNFDSKFEDGELDLFNILSGNEGDLGIPIEGTNIIVESYKGYTETAEFLRRNQLGYLVSDTLYNESSYQDVVDAATFPPVTEITGISGDISNSIEFELDRPSGEQFLYLIWDYRD